MVSFKFGSRKARERKDYIETRKNNRNARNIFLSSLTKLFGFREIAWNEVNKEDLTKIYSGGSKANPLVYSLITKRARLAAEVMRYAKVVDAKTLEVDEKHKAISYIDNPNALDNTRDLFVKRISTDKDIYGEAFVYKQARGLSFDQEVKLFPMNAEYTEVIEGGLTSPIKGFKFGYLDNKLIKPEDVMYIRNYNPKTTTGYTGLSPLTVATRLIGMLESGDKNVMQAYENGGVKNLISMMPSEYGYNSDDIDDAENDINEEEKYRGKSKIFKVALKVDKVGDNMKDLDLINTSKYASQVLCFIYDYPFEMFLGEAKYSNQKEAKELLYTQIGIPIAEEICQALTRFFKLQDEGKKFYINEDDIPAFRKDTKTILESHEKARTSINERRTVIGLEPLKDKIYDQPVMNMGDELGYSEPDPDAFSEE